MPTEAITLIADTIDGAAEKIIHLLEGVDNRREVIYLNGCFGWGASAMLKAVVKQLRSSSRLAGTGATRDLGKIIHVDVSRWQSKRALQKAIAEELELPSQVMELFDQQDEEDDFDGVEQSDRAVIPYVKAAIMNELIAQRFLVVLHVGSASYIDLWEAGVPVMGQLSKRVLWTSRGRFWHPAKDMHELHLGAGKLELESTKWSDAAILVVPSTFYGIEQDEAAVFQVVRQTLYAEAEEVAKYTGVPEPDMSPNNVIECILYTILTYKDHNINWKSHASNYWVCDGIIQGGIDGGRSAWEISDALQRNLSLNFCTQCIELIRVVLSIEQRRFVNRWVSVTKFVSQSGDSAFFEERLAHSVTHQNSTEVQLTSHETSFFWTGGGLEPCLFQHSNKTLRVIHLSHCAFSFSSPPFLSCSNLRFLQLDHCKDKVNAQDDDEENNSCHHRSHRSQQEDCGSWFQNLWVLELSYTDWYWLLCKDMLDLMADLRELNVKGLCNRSMMHLRRCSGAGSNRRRLIKLRVVADDDSDKAAPDNDDYTSSGKRNQQMPPPPLVASSSSSSLFFPDLSSWHILKTVILDGCGDLEQIDCNALPLSLESFTLTSSITSSNKIESISFRGCAKLKHLLLRGLFGRLLELDMSGTTIRTLDLSATQAWTLRRLFLLGCEKLCAILWPLDLLDKMISLEILRIDTTTTTYAAGGSREEGKSNKQQEATASHSASISIGSSSSSVMVCGKDRTIIDSDCYISVRDPRLFRTLSRGFSLKKLLHVKISSTRLASHLQGIDNSGSSQADDDASDRDVFEPSLLVMMRSKWLWDCPPIPEDDSDCARCYISIQDETHAELLLQGGGIAKTTRQLITNRATTLPALVHKKAKTLHLHDSLSICNTLKIASLLYSLN